MTGLTGALTQRAWSFSIHLLHDGRAGRFLGQALVCPSARYASRQLVGADRLDRMAAAPAEWRALERELADTAPDGPLPNSSPLRVLVVRRLESAVVVRCVDSQEVEICSPEQAAPSLDGLLRASVTASRAPDRGGALEREMRGRVAGEERS